MEVNEPFRIDVHHHIIPPDYMAALESVGVHDALGRPFPSWSPNEAISFLDEFSIATAVVSISSPGVYLYKADFGSEKRRCAFAGDLARRCNEYAARLRSEYPRRFGFFAVLPMPEVNLSLREAEYSLDILKADGITLLASPGGKFLGSNEFEELMAELNRRKTVVFVHPDVHETSLQLGIALEGFYLEAPIDTTRAIANLITTGTLERHPHIRWIFSHAGGAIPFLVWRLSLMVFEPHHREQEPKGVRAYLSELYYDTALSTSDFAMKPLLDLTDSSRILFGSDWPWCPAGAVMLEVASLKTITCFNEEILSGVERGNSQQLFQRAMG